LPEFLKSSLEKNFERMKKVNVRLRDVYTDFVLIISDNRKDIPKLELLKIE